MRKVYLEVVGDPTSYIKVADTSYEPTGGRIRRYERIEPPTQTISEVVEDMGFIRNRTQLLVDDSRDLHRSADELHTGALVDKLQTEAHRLAGDELLTLLEELSVLGFSWRDIARAAKVSMPALRKWRMGAPATGENRKKVATLVALCRIAKRDYHINDIAGWLETPLHSNAPITGLDMISANRYDLLLRLISTRRENPEHVLEEFKPGWRRQYESNIEVFTGPDGMPGLCLID